MSRLLLAFTFTHFTEPLLDPLFYTPTQNIRALNIVHGQNCTSPAFTMRTPHDLHAGTRSECGVQWPVT